MKKARKHRPTRKAPHFKKQSRSRKKLKRYKSQNPGTCVVAAGTITWTLPRKLLSLNKLRGGLSRFWDTKAWEREFEGAKVSATDGSLERGSGLRLRLEIVRFAPTNRWFVDKVNLYGGCKGLEDSLVRLGYLVDDNEKWEDGPYPSQQVSDDGKYHTIVRLAKLDVNAAAEAGTQ